MQKDTDGYHLLSETATQQQEPIAIVGIGCRFPGGANDPASFWQLLSAGVDAIQEPPASRWNMDRYYDPVDKPGKSYARQGGFVENIDRFDAHFFGISPREAANMDPQHRLLLEVAWEAMEDAGQIPDQMPAKSGVFIGISGHDYGDIQAAISERNSLNAYSLLGSTLSIAANRLSYTFNLNGPSMVVDTACSSSLVAAHLACQSIWHGESQMALAGGVNIIIRPEGMIGFSKASMLSPDGRCKAFDASANGFVRAEGAGVILLKPYAQAVDDGDAIYATILSTVVNQDGRTNGITVPGGPAQEAMLTTAYEQAGIEPADVDYVEAHGTGTAVGDPIEAKALGHVLSRNRHPSECCIIGSVKTNIGHLEPASGMAGLIKTALAVKHGQIPANLHFETPNPEIPFDELHLRVPQQAEPWPQRGPRRLAGVNSFGFGGTNAHVVVASVPAPSPQPIPLPTVNGYHKSQTSRVNSRTNGYTNRHTPSDTPTDDLRQESTTSLLPLSARSAEALTALATTYREYLCDGSSASLRNICYSASLRRAHHSHRLALFGDTKESLTKSLDAFLQGSADEQSTSLQMGVVSGRPQTEQPKLAFVFSGMGPQWWAMGRELLGQEPRFRAVIERCDKLLRQHVNWSLMAELSADESDSRIQQTEIAQPAIFAVQVGLATLWQSWGIEPDFAVGHSVGEVAAAHVAGALSLADAICVILHRSRLQGMTAGQGKMLAVGLSETDAKRVVAEQGKEISIAAVNSPSSVTLAGDAAVLANVEQQLASEDTFARFLQVDVPYHSPVMATITDELIASLAGLQPDATTTPLYSTVTGAAIDGIMLDGRYWARNVREPVYFADAITALRAEGASCFLEIGPHPVLATAMQETLAQESQERPDGEVVVLHSLRRKRPERATLLHTLGRLYTLNYPLNWQEFYTQNNEQKPDFVRLPTYPWQREQYWLETEESRQERIGPVEHPLLGTKLQSVHPTWSSHLSTQLHPYLRDHTIQRTPTFPAAAYIEMALAAAKQRNDDLEMHRIAIEELDFQKPLFVDDAPALLQLAFTDGQRDFAIYSESNQGWIQYAEGRLRQQATQNPSTSLAISELPEQIQVRCQHQIDKTSCYQRFADVGLDYDQAFQGIEQLWCGNGEVLGELRIPDVIATELSQYNLHPALLDAAFQVIIGLVQEHKAMYLPARVGRVQLYHGTADLAPGQVLWSHVRLVEMGTNSITVDIRLLDADGTLLATLQGFRCQAVGNTEQRETDAINSLLYQYGWEVSQPSQPWELAPYMRTPQEIATVLQEETIQLSQAAERTRYYTELEPKWDTLYNIYVTNALYALGWQPALGERFTATSLADELGVVPAQRQLLTRMLELWAKDGILSAVQADSAEQPKEWELRTLPQTGTPETLWQATMQAHPNHLAEQQLIHRCGTNLAAVLSGEQDPLQLIFPNASLDMAEHLYQDAPNARFYNQLAQKAISEIVDALPADRTIRILEIGAGTGGLSSYLLSNLPTDRIEYLFTDVSPQFIAQAQSKFRTYPFITYQILDVEKDLVEQGIEPHSFNLILASNVLHATCDLRQTLGSVKELLASNGQLIVLEMTRDLRANMLVWGLLDGWWRFTDGNIRPTHPIISVEQWQSVLAEVGFTENAVLADFDTTDEPLQSVILAQGPLVADESSVEDTSVVSTHLVDEPRERWLIFTDGDGIGETVAAQLHAAGSESILIEQGEHFQKRAADRYTLCPDQAEDWQRLLADVVTPTGIVYLWSCDLPSLPMSTDTTETLSLSSFGYQPVMHLVQAVVEQCDIPPSAICFVTRGSQDLIDIEDVSRSHQRMLTTQHGKGLMTAPLWALGRVIRNEHPQLHAKMIDLSLDYTPAEIEMLLGELRNDDQEDEIALRGTARYVHRLQRQTLEAGDTQVFRGRHVGNLGFEDPLVSSEHQANSVQQPFYLEVTNPGILDDLTFRPFHRRQPAPGEVEIEVKATALNFKDVAKAMGLLGDESLDGTTSGRAVGLECSGVISAVGESVDGFQIGDAVVALAANSFSTHAYVDAGFVAHKPAQMRFEEASTLLLVFLTAHYALHHLGRIQQDERVLIHAGAGGVGLAAIQIAQAAGAEIFATAGTPQKREFLQALGIPATHVMDSRSLDFADQIMDVTNGEGVDLVLNSLMGDALAKSLDLLAPFGRFLELGKRDIEQNHKLGLRPFQDNLAFFAIDLDRLANERPKLASNLFDEIMPLFADGTYSPLPHRVFSMAHVVDAFRYMAQARHIGKVVVSMDSSAVAVASMTSSQEPIHFREDATYLITGGLGGFGLAVAQWMVDHGARHLLLMGRSGAKTKEQQQAIQNMEATGASVVVAQADVTQADDVTHVLTAIPEQTPLRGIIHAAMVLDDALLVNITPERFDQVMAPKALGAWHLHQQTLQMELDHFVLFSSASTAVGNPGQGSYVAANGFLEALAFHRRSHGLPALTVSWGAIAGVGYVANNHEVTEHLKRIGFEMLPFAQALTVLGELMQRESSQMTVGQVDWQQWAMFNNAGVLPRFAQLMTADPNQQHEDQQRRFLDRLAETPTNERHHYLQEHLRSQLAKVLGVSKPEQIEPHQPFFEMGLDSLMAVELKNRLEKSLERSLPQMMLFNYPSLAELVDHLVSEHLRSTFEFGNTAVDQRTDRSTVIPVEHTENDEQSAAILNLDTEVVLDPTIRFDGAVPDTHRTPSSILLTGATGFLGAFLLRELCEQTAAQIYCLVRANSEAQGLDRIRQNLSHYQLWDESLRTCIVPVLGDLSNPLLGLTRRDFDALAEQVDVIYHNGAWVNFMASYADLKAANVRGTEEILRLAGQGHIKPLHFVSSYSVFFSKERTQAEAVHEHGALSPAATLCENGYVQSKWVAEQLVTIAQERGLPAAIYRPGVLAGDSRTGIANPTDLANRMILGCVQLGYVPAENTLMDLCPVDYASRAIVHLSQRDNTLGNAFHLVNPEPHQWHDWVTWINELGYPLQALPYDDWKAKLQQALTNTTAHNALSPFVDALPRAKGDTKHFMLTQVYLEGKAPRFNCQNTLAGLAGSQIAYPSVDADLLHRYFAYFVEQGVLQPADHGFSRLVP